MKKVFIYILLFYYVLHFVIPGAYFLTSGNFNTYSNVYDEHSILKGFLLNTVTIALTILIISFIPEKNKGIAVKPKFYSITPLFYFSILFSVAFFFIRGGFEGRLSNNMAGSIFSYLAYFLNPNMILLCILFYQRKSFSIVILFLVYLVYTTLTGSRSGFLSLFIIFLMYPAFSNFQLYKKSIRQVLIALAVISPVLFLAATIFIREADIPLTPDIIIRMIMGRLSFLETSMLPIHYKDLGDTVDVFYQKYSVLNQVKLIIDTLFPGNLFGNDVMPNQYYRAAFMGYTESYVAENYTSINITLPIYLYMYFGSVFSCVFGIAILVIYYRLCSKVQHNIFLFVPLLITLYGLLVFFDWTVWFLQFFIFMLTTFTVYGFSVLRQAFVQVMKRRTGIAVN